VSDQQQESGAPPTWSTEPPQPPDAAAPGTPNAAPTAASSAAAAASAATAAFRSRLSVGEQLAVAGAGLIVLVELVFGLVIEEYWAGDPAFLLALAVLAVAYIRHVRKGELSVPYATVIRAAGFGILALAVVDLPYELRHGVFNNLADLIGGAGYYGGAALMTVGALTIKDA
jgi:hypothetical protein